MLKKMMSMLLVVLLVNLAVLSSVYAHDTKAEKDAKFTEKVKTNIAKLGVGVDSKVEVKLKDGTKLKGYVSEINEDGFVVTDTNGKSTPVSYPQTKQVKGNNLSAGVIFAIGFVAVFVIALLILKSSK